MDHVRIQCTGGTAIVSPQDAEKVSQLHWYVVRDKNNVYAASKFGKRPVLMHRLVLGFPDAMVDHRDCNGLNNTRENLRLATAAQNQFNKRPVRNTSSNYKGVHKTPKGLFRASISRNRATQRWQQVFTDEVIAARAYDVKAVEWFGKFAWLNFPGEIEASIKAVQEYRHPQWKALTQSDVDTIREMRSTGATASQIARVIGKNVKTIEAVIEGRSWRIKPVAGGAQ